MTERKCLVFNFADIEVREREFLLIKRGEHLSVEPTAFRVLLFLLRNPGQLVSKEKIVASVWNDIAVSDNSLTRAIAQLRRVLDDDSREPRYILTVPTVGYRFICQVNVRDDGFGIGTGATATAPEGGNGFAQSNRIDSATGTQTNSPVGQDVLSVGLDEKQRETSGSQKRRAWKILFAGIAAALLLLMVAGFILRRFTRAGAVPSPGLQHLAMERRLTSNPSDVPLRNAVISRDGKYLAYADPTGLYLREISSSETRPWSLPRGFVARPQSWFPDGTHLLVVRDAGQSQDFSLWKPILYKLSILGSEPRLMMNDAWAGYVSPDGSQIAYMPVPNVNEIWIMDADGANPRKVVVGAEPKKLWNGTYQNWIHPVAWSPTGQHLAYVENHVVAGPSPIGPTRTLHITDSNGGQTMVLDDPRIGGALWWADGRVLFSYREDPFSGVDNDGVYSISVDERTGMAAGPPQPVTQAEGRIGSMSGTADGKRLVVCRGNAPAQVFIATFDAASRRWNEPRRLVLDAKVDVATAWTSDSKAVLFISNRDGTWKLFKQAIDATTPEVLAEGRSLTVPRLSADGSQVLYLSSPNPDDVSFPVSLMSKPLAGGTPRVVIQGKGIWNHQCAKSPGTRCIFSQLDGQSLIFRSFDLEHGEGRQLLRMVGNPNWSLSPDGSKLAIVLDPHHIRFVSLDTGAAHDVAVRDWALNAVDWGASGLFMPSFAPNGLPIILEVDQTGKARVILTGSANTELGWMVQSPNSRYALVGEYIPTDNNAWIVNDF